MTYHTADCRSIQWVSMVLFPLENKKKLWTQNHPFCLKTKHPALFLTNLISKSQLHMAFNNGTNNHSKFESVVGTVFFFLHDRHDWCALTSLTFPDLFTLDLFPRQHKSIGHIKIVMIVGKQVRSHWNFEICYCFRQHPKHMNFRKDTPKKK